MLASTEGLQTAMIRVMVVDDHPAVQHALGMLFEDANGMELVGQAVSGRQAIELCQHLEDEQTPCDVMLLDLNMPRMNGLATAAALHQAHPYLKIILLSSTTYTDQIRAKALPPGITHCLPKTISGPDLLTTIRTSHSLAG